MLELEIRWIVAVDVAVDVVVDTAEDVSIAAAAAAVAGAAEVVGVMLCALEADTVAFALAPEPEGFR